MTTRIKDLGSIITGNTPKTSESANYGSDDICFVKPSDFADGDVTYIKSSEFYISEFARKKSRILPPESVLVTCIGTIGKVAINQVECAFNQQINAIIPNRQRCITTYLAYAIQAKQVTMQEMANAPVVPILNKTQFSDIEINVPPIIQQQHIAAVLDKISYLISLRKQQLDKLDELVKARFVEMFGEPETNTKGWPISNMGNLCSVGSSKRIYKSEQSTVGIPFWRVSDLTNLINTGVATENLYIPEKRYAELQAQGQVPVKGDILITSRGTLGQCYIVKATDRFYFQDGMISWLSEYADSITPLYISHLFSMPGFQKQIDSMQAGSTVAYLSIAMIKKLKVMIPDAETQQQFATFVEQIDQCRLTIQRGLDKLEMLKKALMQEYFGR